MSMVFCIFDTSLVVTGLNAVSGVPENEGGGWLGWNGAWSSVVRIIICRLSNRNTCGSSCLNVVGSGELLVEPKRLFRTEYNALQVERLMI